MTVLALNSKADAARKVSAKAERVGVTVPAAWPAGTSLLAQAYEACRYRDDDEDRDAWLMGAPDSMHVPPALCPQRSRIQPNQ